MFGLMRYTYMPTIKSQSLLVQKRFRVFVKLVKDRHHWVAYVDFYRNTF